MPAGGAVVAPPMGYVAGQTRRAAADTAAAGLWATRWRRPVAPLPDRIGTARRLVDGTGTATDAYSLDAFGRQMYTWGTTPNPYRGVCPERSRRGAAWGYITDTPGSGLLQLGARFYGLAAG